jgi:hypothetical protein
MRSKNKTLGIFVFFVICVFLTLTVVKSNAEQFTFHVPVELKNLHKDIVKGRIDCIVSNQQTSVLPATSPWNNFFEFDIAGGNYIQPVTVKLNIENPWIATKYSCNLWLKSKYNANWARPSTFTTGDTTLTSFKDFIFGVLPSH